VPGGTINGKYERLSNDERLKVWEAVVKQSDSTPVTTQALVRVITAQSFSREYAAQKRPRAASLYSISI
jgi:hypothetical protein